MRLRRILYDLMTIAPTTVAASAGALAGIDADYFTLLGLPRRYQTEGTQLDAAWRTLQAKVHPDRFAAGSDAEKRVALQWASRVNEAYRVLRSPLQRARYLCELAGFDVQAESNTSMSPAFLMQQMEWRENLDAARRQTTPQAYDALAAQLAAARHKMQDTMADLLDRATPDYVTAVSKVREWMFIERVSEEMNAAQY